MKRVIRFIIVKDLPKIPAVTPKPEPLWLSKLKPEYTQEELNKKYVPPSIIIEQLGPSIEGSW